MDQTAGPGSEVGPPAELLKWVRDQNAPVLEQLDPENPLLKDKSWWEKPTVADIYRLNKAIEDARRSKGSGSELPGHHVFMNKYNNEFENAGVPRWARDIVRPFIPREQHSADLHSELDSRTSQIFRENPNMTSPDIYDRMKGLLNFLRGLESRIEE
jgi:hypothetical protein